MVSIVPSSLPLIEQGSRQDIVQTLSIPLWSGLISTHIICTDPVWPVRNANCESNRTGTALSFEVIRSQSMDITVILRLTRRSDICNVIDLKEIALVSHRPRLFLLFRPEFENYSNCQTINGSVKGEEFFFSILQEKCRHFFSGAYLTLYAFQQAVPFRSFLMSHIWWRIPTYFYISGSLLTSSEFSSKV